MTAYVHRAIKGDGSWSLYKFNNTMDMIKDKYYEKHGADGSYMIEEKQSYPIGETYRNEYHDAEGNWSKESGYKINT